MIVRFELGTSLHGELGAITVSFLFKNVLTLQPPRKHFVKKSILQEFSLAVPWAT